MKIKMIFLAIACLLLATRTGCGLFNNETVQPSGQPATPIGLKATSGISNTVNLSWKANQEKDLMGYKIYEAYGDTEPTDDKFTLKKIVNATETSTQIMDLTNGVVYWYKIAAFDNGSNESLRSSAVRIKVPEEDPPILLGVSQMSFTIIHIMFNEPVELISANTKENYTVTRIDSGKIMEVAVTNAQLQVDSETVILTIEPTEHPDSVTVCNVRDKYNNAIVCPPGQSAGFLYEE